MPLARLEHRVARQSVALQDIEVLQHFRRSVQERVLHSEGLSLSLSPRSKRRQLIGGRGYVNSFGGTQIEKRKGGEGRKEVY